MKSKPWFREVTDNASRTLQFGDAPTPAQPQRNLRSSTKEQRKAKPLWKAKLPDDLSDFNSPTQSKKNEKFSNFMNFTFFRQLI